MTIRLKGKMCVIASTGAEGERYIVCVHGSNVCGKSENQGIFDENCFYIEEIVE